MFRGLECWYSIYSHHSSLITETILFVLTRYILITKHRDRTRHVFVLLYNYDTAFQYLFPFKPRNFFTILLLTAEIALAIAGELDPRLQSTKEHHSENGRKY